MKFGSTITCLLASLLLINACNTQQEQKRPNILFIMADDHAVQAVSALDGSLNQTPNIDRIADEGMIFLNSFCTNSICAPVRAVNLTGKYNHLNGQINNNIRFDGSQMTYPKLLQKEGYQTAMIGKWHLQSDPEGFDYWNVLPGQGEYYNPDFIEMGKRTRVEGYVTDLITDFSIEWLKNRDPEKPFCLLLHHKAPHRNWMPGPGHLTMYDDTTIKVPDNYFDDYDTRSAAAREQEMTVYKHMQPVYDLKVSEGSEIRHRSFSRMNEQQKAAWYAAYNPKNKAFLEAGLEGRELAEWKLQRYLKDYLRCIASVDDNIGRVLDYLDETGLAENTIVIYTSDQGFYLGEHGWFDKRFMYEESLRMPLLIRFPKEIRAGTKSDKMVLNLDFAETLLDLGGVTIPEEMQGESFRELFANPDTEDWRDAIYYHYYEYPGVHAVKRHYGIRTRRYKLMHFYYDIDAWELYDLAKDPEEMNNLYGNPEYEGIIAELKERLEKLQEQYREDPEDFLKPTGTKTSNHLGVHKAVTLNIQASGRYNKGNPDLLTDGELFTLDPYWTSMVVGWLGFEGTDMEAVIDLEKPTPVSEVTVRFLQRQGSWVFFPEKVEVFVSDDGVDFDKLGETENRQPGKSSEASIQAFTVASKVNARYVKVIATNIKKCPDWHAGAGGKAWIFVDEVVVR